MPKHTVYILGPMRNRRLFNFPAFDAMQTRLEEVGIKAISPADLDRQHGFDPVTLPNDWDWSELPPELDLDKLIERDVRAILSRATAWVALPGWEQSVGAIAEAHLCKWKRLPRLDPDNHFQPWEEDTNILHVADHITSEDRREQYGHPAVHWRKTVDAMYALMPGLFARKPEPWEWGMMVNIDKIARFTNKPKHDTLVDMTGYPRCIQLVFEYGENPL